MLKVTSLSRPPDYLPSGEQAGHGHCAGHVMWSPKVHLERRLLRLDSGPKHLAVATELGWHNSYSCYPEAEAHVDWETVGQHVHSEGYQCIEIQLQQAFANR